MDAITRLQLDCWLLAVDITCVETQKRGHHRLQIQKNGQHSHENLQITHLLRPWKLVYPSAKVGTEVKNMAKGHMTNGHNQPCQKHSNMGSGVLSSPYRFVSGRVSSPLSFGKYMRHPCTTCISLISGTFNSNVNGNTSFCNKKKTIPMYRL